MRIDDRDAVKTPASRSGAARESGRSGPARHSGDFAVEESGGDQVALAHRQTLLERTLEVGKAERQRRIEQLKADVQSGAYRVDAGELSRAIVNEMLGGESG